MEQRLAAMLRKGVGHKAYDALCSFLDKTYKEQKSQILSCFPMVDFINQSQLLIYC